MTTEAARPSHTSLCYRDISTSMYVNRTPVSRVFDSTHLDEMGNKKAIPQRGGLFITHMVEAAGIEPASVSDPPSALHA